MYFSYSLFLNTWSVKSLEETFRYLKNPAAPLQLILPFIKNETDTGAHTRWLLSHSVPAHCSSCALWRFFQCWRQCIRHCWLLSISQSVPDAVSSTSESSFFSQVCAGASGALLPAAVRGKRWEIRQRELKKNKNPQTHQNRPLLLFRFHGGTIDNTVTVRIIVRGVRVAAEASGKLNSCKFKMGMHYERAARDEAALQKDCRKRIFSRKKCGVGKRVGGAQAGRERGGRADRVGRLWDALV